MNKKALLLLVAITAVTVGAGCVRKLTSPDSNSFLPYNGAVEPSDPTETTTLLPFNGAAELSDDRAAYKNEAFFYEFIYPLNWQLGDSPDSPVPNTTTRHIAFDADGYRFQVDVVNPSRPCGTATECIKQNKVSNSPDQTNSGLVSAEAPFWLSEIIEEPSGKDRGWRYQVYYAYKNEMVYQIVAMMKIEDAAMYASSINEVLATFRFTKVQQ